MVQSSWTATFHDTLTECRNDYAVFITPLGPSPVGLLTLNVILEMLPVDCSVTLCYIRTDGIDLPSTVATPS